LRDNRFEITGDVAGKFLRASIEIKNAPLLLFRSAFNPPVGGTPNDQNLGRVWGREL
jgi:hypothetical protein